MTSSAKETRKVSVCATLLMLLSLAAGMVDGQQQQQQQVFLREPVDQTAIQGEHVTLPCRVQNKKGILQWTRDGFGLGVGRNLTGFDRYRMSGSDDEGDFTLDIYPVTLEDDAEYQCQVGAAEGVAPIRSQNAILTVTVPPEPPVILNGNQLKTTEDRKVKIKCSSRGGKPAAEITWLDGSGTVISDGIEQETEEIESTKRVTAISTLTLTAAKTDHNSTLTCQAQNSADREPKSTKIHLLVEYAPHVSIKIDHTPVFERDTVVFTCEAHANPPDMTYRWFVDGDLVPGNHGTEHRIANIDRKFHNKIVKCEVNNVIGKSEETETLDVHYAPVFVQKPRDVSKEKGEEATLHCQVDGNPKPTYTWFRNGDFHTVHSYESDLTVTISEVSVGKYICRASVRGFPEVTSFAEILMRGPPKVIRKNAVQFGRVGSNVEVSCDSFAIPAPPNINWSMYGFPLDTSSGGGSGGHYRVLNKPRKDGILSTLIIRNAMDSDFGDYNCTVQNPHGADSFIIKLKKEKSLPLIIILSAVIGGIVLTVAAILIMILCRRSSTALSLKAMANGGAPGSGTDGGGGGGSSIIVNEKTMHVVAPSSVITSSTGGGHSSKISSSSKVGYAAAAGNHHSNRKQHNMINENSQQHYLIDQPGDDETDGSGPGGAGTGDEEGGWGAGNGHDPSESLLPQGQPRTNNFEFPARMDVGYDGYAQYGGYGVNFGMGYHHPPPHPSHLMNEPRYAGKYGGGNPYLRGGEGERQGAVSPLASPHRHAQQQGGMGGGGRPYATLNNRVNNGPYSPSSTPRGVGGGPPSYGTMSHQQHKSKNGFKSNNNNAAPGGGSANHLPPPSSTAAANNYVGTMLGTPSGGKKKSAAGGKSVAAAAVNGSSNGGGGGGGRVMAVNGGVDNSGQYIVSSESDVNPAAMATHV